MKPYELTPYQNVRDMLKKKPLNEIT